MVTDKRTISALIEAVVCLASEMGESMMDVQEQGGSEDETRWDSLRHTRPLPSVRSVDVTALVRAFHVEHNFHPSMLHSHVSFFFLSRMTLICCASIDQKLILRYIEVCRPRMLR